MILTAHPPNDLRPFPPRTVKGPKFCKGVLCKGHKEGGVQIKQKLKHT